MLLKPFDLPSCSLFCTSGFLGQVIVERTNEIDKTIANESQRLNESRVLDSVSHSISRLMEVAWCLSVSLRLDNTVCTALIKRMGVHISAECAF